MKALIIEDEPKSREILTSIVQGSFPELELLAPAKNVSEAILFINTFLPDIIFLDISLEGGNGFDVLEAISEDILVIFTTAYDEHVFEAFKHNTIDYLLKPIDPIELKSAVRKAFKRVGDRKYREELQDLIGNFKRKGVSTKIGIPTMEGLIFIDHGAIIYCEADGKYTNIITTTDKLLSSKSLKTYEELLSEFNFCRVHDKYLINISHIKKYIKVRGGYVIMSEGSKIEVSARRKDYFLKHMDF